MKCLKRGLINPKLFRHEALFIAEKEYQLPLRLALIGLSFCCNRQSCFSWNPNELKSLILPNDELDMERLLEALWTRGFIKKYEHRGAHYGCLLAI